MQQTYQLFFFNPELFPKRSIFFLNGLFVPETASDTSNFRN